MVNKSKTAAVPANPRPAWGLAAGLLTGCAVTLLGVMLQLEPETILLRSVLGGAVAGMLVSVITSSLRIATAPREEE